MNTDVSLGDALTAFSILTGILTFAVGYRYKNAAERRKRTFDLVLSVIEPGRPAHQVNIAFAGWLREGRTFPDDDVKPEEDEVLVALLDQYDLIADVAERRVINPEMVVVHLGGRMRSAHSALAGYISARRKRLGRPALYRSFERFVHERIGAREV